MSLDSSNYGFAACNYTLIERNRWYCEGKWPRDACVRCYVTGSWRARGVNQQRHVSKGASPAHSSEVALRRSKLQNNAAPGFTSNRPVFTSHAAACSVIWIMREDIKIKKIYIYKKKSRAAFGNTQFFSGNMHDCKKQTQLELQRLSYLPAHSELLGCRREKFHGVYLKDICFGWTQEAADVGVGRRWHFLFCFFTSQFSSGHLNAAKRCKNSISYFINFRQTPDSGWRACLPRACTSNGAGSGGNSAGVTGPPANSD